MTVVPQLPYFFFVSPIEEKTERPPFLTPVEVMKAVNTLTEHGFQYAFKHGRSAGKGVYVRKETI
jgi:hypothetical protein